jgi:hypothetical protein
MGDEGNKLSKFEELHQELEAFKKNKQDEFLLLPIEKWMVKRLGVARRPNKSGSMRRYYHALLEEKTGEGEFGIHVIHGKRAGRPKILRKNFLNFIYPVLKKIVKILEE